MKKIVFSMVLAALLFILVPAFATVTPTFKKFNHGTSEQPAGFYDVLVLKGGHWQQAGILRYDKRFRSKQLDLNPFLSADETVKIRLFQNGGGAAHIDAVQLGGLGPAKVEGIGDPLALKKIRHKDFDVIDAYCKTLDLTFTPGNDDKKLTMTARVEPEAISKVPFQFPTHNLFRTITNGSIFYPYKLNRKFDPAADINATPSNNVFFKEYCLTGSGHPSGFTYGWVSNDEKNLYVKIDFTPDNTRDGDKDYAKLYVRRGSNLKEFKISEIYKKWGNAEFTYTENAAYQHKVYDFTIPLETLDLDQPADGEKIDLAFAAYGTATPGYLTTDTAFDEEYQRYLIVYVKYAGHENAGWITGQMVNADGSLFGTEFTISEYPDCNYPSIVHNPTRANFLVTFEGGPTMYGIFGQIVVPNGTLQGSNFPISDGSDPIPVNAKGAHDDVYDQYLVIWEDQRNGVDKDIYGQVLDGGNGSPLGDNFPVMVATGSQYEPAVAFDSYAEKYLAVWTDARNGDYWDIYGRVIDFDGTLNGLDFAISSELGSRQRDPAIAYDDANQLFSVVWEHGDPDPDNIFGKFITIRSATYDNSFYTDLRGPQPCTLDGTFGCIVWALEGDFVISAAINDQQNPYIIKDNQGFLTVWDDKRNISTTGEDIYGRYIGVSDPDLYPLLGTVSSPFVGSTDEESYPSLAFNPISNETLLAYRNYTTLTTTDTYEYVFLGDTTDEDLDGLPDSWEQDIIDFDTEDGINTIYDVNPGDDFDGDWVSNQREYDNGTLPTDAGDFTPPGTGAIKGTVNGIGGTPIVTDDIRLQVITGDPCHGWQQVDDIITSDGNYIFVGLDHNIDYRVRTDNMWQSNYVNEWYASPSSSISCYGAELLDVPENESADKTDFQLDLGVEVSGTVYKADGETAITDVHINVAAFRAGNPCHTHEWSTGTQTNLTDGSFTIKGVPVGTDSVFLRTDNMNQSNYVDESWRNLGAGSTPYCSQAELLEVPGGGVTGLSFQLDAGGWIAGDVFDASTTDGIGNLWMHVFTNSCGGDWLGGVHTESDGSYTIMGLLPGDVYLQTCAHCQPQLNYVDEWWDDSDGTTNCNDAAPITIVAGAEAGDKDFYLDGGGTISGTVRRDSDGHTITGISIEVWDYNTGYGFGNYPIQSNGSYSITGLSAGNYRLMANASGAEYASEYYNNALNWNSAAAVSVTVGQTNSGIDFSLGLGGSISGTVSADTDGPLGGHWMWVERYDNGTWFGGSHTLSNGYYQISGLPTGDYRVHASNSSPPYAWEWYNDTYNRNNAQSVSVTPGDDTPNINFGLAKTGTISGSITDTGLTGLENIWVEVYAGKCWNDHVRSDWTDSNGDYTIGGIPPTDVYVRAWPNHQNYVDEWYDANNGNYDCNLSQTATVVSEQTTSGINIPLNDGPRRIQWWEIAVGSNGELSACFDLRPSLNNYLESVVVSGPDNFSYTFDIANNWFDWLTECSYLIAWCSEGFGTDVTPGVYSMTFNFIDGAQESHARDVQPADPPPPAVDPDDVSYTVNADGSMDFNWVMPDPSGYYHIRIYGADGNRYYRSNIAKGLNSVHITADDLRCLEKGQTYLYQVRSYDKSGLYNTVVTGVREHFVYDPASLTNRIKFFGAGSWNGNLAVGFSVRPGSEQHVTGATVTGPSFNHTFHLTDDWVDLSTETNFIKSWFKEFATPFQAGQYTLIVDYDDGHQETKVIDQTDPAVAPVDPGSMNATILDDGAIRFSWDLPSGVNGQKYYLRVLNIDESKVYYQSNTNSDMSQVTVDFNQLRALDHGQTFKWFVRAHDNDQRKMVQSDGPNFVYDPFSIAPNETISGKVLDDGGQGIVGMKVKAYWNRCNNYPIAETETGAGGNYTLTGVFPGDIYVQACPDCNHQNFIEEWWDGASGSGARHCSQAAPATVVAGTPKTNIDFNLEPRPQRLDIFSVAVYDGELSPIFSILPGFRNHLTSATLLIPNTGRAEYPEYTFDLIGEENLWDTECHYFRWWEHSFGSVLPDDYIGTYTLTLDFADGSQETYTRTLQNVPIALASNLNVDVKTDGGVAVSWTKTAGDYYYNVIVRDADGKEYFRKPDLLNAEYYFISADKLRCLEIGKTYFWMVQTYDNLLFSHNKVVTLKTPTPTAYNPTTISSYFRYKAIVDADGELGAGFNLREGSVGHLKNATVSGPGGFNYQFNLIDDWDDKSTEVKPFFKSWWHQDPAWPIAAGEYMINIELDEDGDNLDNKLDEFTLNMRIVAGAAADSGTMVETINPDGSITFSWELPAGIMSQDYEVHVRDTGNTQGLYISPAMYNGTTVTASAYDLRGLEPNQNYEWFVRAREQWDSITGRDSVRKSFLYNPFNIVVQLDNDGDGYNASIDCNDNDPYINPGEAEIPGDGIDQNCDGTDPEPITAGTYYVNNVSGTDDPVQGGDPGSAWRSLRYALTAISNGEEGSYILNLAGGTFTLASEGRDVPMILNQDVTVDGQGATIDGAGDHGEVENPWKSGLIVGTLAEDVEIKNTTIQNFDQGLRIMSQGGCVSLENVTITACQKGIQLVSSQQVDIDLGGNTISSCETGIEITADSSGNIIHDGTVSNNSGDGIVVDSSNVPPLGNLINRVDVIGNDKNGIAIRGGFDTQVSDCLIAGNNYIGGPPPNYSGYAGVYISSGTAQIKWNTIEGNSCAGIFAEETTDKTEIHGNVIYGNREGIKLSFTSGVLIQSNTISRNDEGLMIGEGSAPTVLCNIIWGNTALRTDLVVNGDYRLIEYNDIGTTNLPGLPPGNISLDPRFVDALNDDYKLTDNSPCIDGTNLVDTGRDRDNVERPLSSTWDIGAYESPAFPDVDEDGMDDEWEQRKIVDADPEDTITNISQVNWDDDFDGDGKNNLQEFQEGTDPTTFLELHIVSPVGEPVDTNNTSIVVSGTAANATVGVTMSQDETPIMNWGPGTESWSHTVTLVPGENLISLQATDSSGSITASVTVMRDSELPQVTITVPESHDGYETTAESITISGLASDDTEVNTVSWSRAVTGFDQIEGNADGTDNWTAADIPLVEGQDNVITITAADVYAKEGSATITVTRLAGTTSEETDLTPEPPTEPIDPLDFDGDGYVNTDESDVRCSTDPYDDSAGSLPTNWGLVTNGTPTKYPQVSTHPDFDSTKVIRNEDGDIIDSYLWPDCINEDDDRDTLTDICEDNYAGFDSRDAGDNPDGNPDNDMWTNYDECENETNPFVAELIDFTFTVTDLVGGEDYDHWLPEYNDALRLQITWDGTGPPPAQIDFVLEETSRRPGRVVNDPNPAQTATNYPAWYEFNGFDFGLTALNPVTNPTVHSYAQELLGVAGTAGVYTVYLQSWDYAGRTQVKATVPGFPDAKALIQLPKGSGGSGISNAWVWDSDAVRVDPTADIDQILYDQKDYPYPLGDNLDYFKEYRGILFTEGGQLKHLRLNPHRKDLFVRGAGYDPGSAPFAIGPAFANAGIDVHDTTDWGHDATEDGSFFIYYRNGTIGTVFGTQVGASNTNWVSHWPKREWEFKIDSDGDTAWTPVTSWAGAGNLILAYPYPGVAGSGTYAIRMPVPHINVVIVRHDSTSLSPLPFEDGFINRLTAIAPTQDNEFGNRVWTWDHKGHCSTNSTEDLPVMYGLPVTYQIPLDHYFLDRPYIEGTLWSDETGWSEATEFDRKLAPLGRVEDRVDQLSPMDGIMPGDDPNGRWDGDQRTEDKLTWDDPQQVNPFDIDGDGLVELPQASDPEAHGGQSVDEADKAHVLMHTITHELGHAVAGPYHTKDPTCLMHYQAIDWKRHHYFSDYYRSLLRVHNILREF